MLKSIVVIIVEDDMPTMSEAVVIDVDDAFTPASEASGTENQAEIVFLYERRYSANRLRIGCVSVAAGASSRNPVCTF